jgi:hypothetical protein
VLGGEAGNTNLTVFGLTGLGMEPMIYHTLVKHTDHYNIDKIVYWALNSNHSLTHSISTDFEIYKPVPRKEEYHTWIKLSSSVHP